MPLSHIVDSSYIETKLKHNFVLKNVNERVQARKKFILYLNTIEMSIMHISFDKFLVCYEDVYMKCGREGTFD